MMTFWQWLDENKTKLLGALTTVVAGLLGMIAAGMFNAQAGDTALMSPHALRWLAIDLSLLNMVLGGGTVAAGVSNATRTRIAEAQAQTAQQMAVAVNTTPPATPVPIVPPQKEGT